MIRLLLAALWLAAAPLASAQQPPVYPTLSGPIVDGAKLLPADAAARIEGKLAAHEAKTGDQLVIATVPSLSGASIEDYANGLFRQWRLGERDRNNGALLLVAPKERKVRIEVGYGLEGALTDALSKVIITTAITPKFRNGDFVGGIEAGADAILSVLAGDAEEWQRRARIREDDSSPVEVVAVVFAALVIFVLIAGFMRELQGARGRRMHRRRDGTWVVLPSSTGSWGSGWGGSSGGFGGGSSGGGFSGGGGSSGGGGASGDW